jgi:hypothetical protein
MEPREKKTVTVWMRVYGGDYEGVAWERDTLESFVVYVPTMQHGEPQQDYDGSVHYERKIVENWQEYVRDSVEHEIYKRTLSRIDNSGEDSDVWESFEIIHMAM